MIQLTNQSQSRKRHSIPKGFTLVELLVVIGIIAVLMSILLPVLSKARAAANRVPCLSNVRQLHVGMMLYCNDNHDWFPTAAMVADGVGFVFYDDDWIHWQTPFRNIDDSAIAKYLSASGDPLRKLLRCPSDTLDNRKPYVSMFPKGQGTYDYSYGLNEGVGQNLKAPYTQRSKRTQWRRPAEKILFGEGLSPFCGGWGPPGKCTRRHGEKLSTKHAGLTGTNSSAVFFDGHAEGVDDDLYWMDVRFENTDG